MKLLHHTTILLFALVSVFIGCQPTPKSSIVRENAYSTHEDTLFQSRFKAGKIIVDTFTFIRSNIPGEGPKTSSILVMDSAFVYNPVTHRLTMPHDTVFIHDTVYRPKNVHIRNAEDVYIGGERIINVNGDNNNVITQRN